MALTQVQVGWELGGSKGRFARGAYLTDERQLYRVAARVIMERQAFVELEDCATLSTLLVAQAELAGMRSVRPGAAAV
jgi:hypothetical protein